MAKINIEAEMLSNHTDEEIIDFLDGLMTGLLKSYRAVLEKGQPETLLGNFGDVSLAAIVIREMKKRNTSRQAQRSAI